MASYTFKNLLVVERASSNITTTQLLRNRHGQWFPDRQPFEYQSDEDKILVFYPSALGIGDSLHRIDTEVFLPNGEIQGIVKMLCDCNNVRIISVQFHNAQECKTFLGMLHDYLVKTIINARATVTDRFVLYWDPALFLDIPYLEKCAKDSRLLSDPVKKIHAFDGTGADVSTAVVEPNPNTFGESNTIKTNTFGVASATTSIPNSTFTPFGQQTPNTFGVQQTPNTFGVQQTPNTFGVQQTPNTFGTGFKTGQFDHNLFDVGTQPKPFSNTDTFSNTKPFSNTDTFSNTKPFSNTDTFSNTKPFSNTDTFSNTKPFSNTDTFSNTKPFSNTNTFSNTKPFSNTNTFSNTKPFSNTDTFSNTKPFSNTNTFSNTDTFSNTKPFSNTDTFSSSGYLRIR